MTRRSAFTCFVAWSGAADAAAADEPSVIEFDKLAFRPQEITVPIGAQVTWVNRNQTIHSIIGQDRKFSSQGLDTGDRFSVIFGHRGDFIYACSLHPYMKGIVHVREPPAKAP